MIATTLLDLGWDVDVIDWDDQRFRPTVEYAMVIALDGNGVRLVDTTPGPRPELLLHLTTAYPRFHNAAEVNRLSELQARRGQALKPRRQLRALDAMDTALEWMSAATLIGNSWTTATYPEHIRSKLHTLNVTTTAEFSAVPADLDMQAQCDSQQERAGVLWLGGGGAVHKGLDITLEAALLRPETRFTVIGGLEAELDFVLAYRRELFQTVNVSYEGYVSAGSQRFDRLLARHEFVVAPTCSEGMSNALAYCLARGLIPIYSESAGLDIPRGVGTRLKSTEPADVARQLATLERLPRQSRSEMADAASEFAASSFSRERYAARMREVLSESTAHLP